MRKISNPLPSETDVTDVGCAGPDALFLQLLVLRKVARTESCTKTERKKKIERKIMLITLNKNVEAWVLRNKDFIYCEFLRLK